MPMALSKLLCYGEFEYVEEISVSAHYFIINFDNNGEVSNNLIVYVEYLEYLQPLHRGLPFKPKKVAVNKKNKLGCSVRDKKYYRCHITLLRQALKHTSILKRLYRVVKFKQSKLLYTLL